jgi:phosphohistidine phosphatase SixA
VIVTIWRHGQAGSAFTDRERELTGAGIDDVGFGCQQFHEVCAERGLPHPDRILHSSWVRTTQTADIIASAFTHAERQAAQALIPGCTPADVDGLLEKVISEEICPEHLVLVSHQPLVSRLADHYLDNGDRVPSLTPGALVSLELEVAAAGCGRLLFWALPPGYEAHV